MSVSVKIPAATLDETGTYRLLTGAILPRPIAWVSTVDPQTGVVNLAPFSFFTGVSVVPPMVAFAVERRHGVKKDTVRNVEATGEFVLNLVTSQLAEAMVISAQDLPPEQSEVDVAGLKMLPGDAVKVPRVAESPVHMECKLVQILELGSSPHSLVIGEVVQFHIRDDLYENGKIGVTRLNALGRLAGDWYCLTDDLIKVTRRDWRKDTY